MKSAIVIGGGMSGCTISYFLSQSGWEVTLLEKESYLGGGCKTFFYGGHPFTYGPRPLVARQEQIYEYFNKLIPMRKLKHHLLTYVESDGAFYSYPIHEDDVKNMPDCEKIYQELANRPIHGEFRNFEEFWIASVGELLYNKFINNYSKKMWRVDTNTILTEFKWSPKGKTLQSGTREVLCDAIIAYPKNYDGYDQYFKICTENVNVHLNIEAKTFDLEKKAVLIDEGWLKGDILVNTISLDDLMNYWFGKLAYVGRDFLKVVLPIKEIFPEDVQFLYYPNEEPFLRIVEYKKLTFYKSLTTLLVLEIPSFSNRLYPVVSIKDELDRAAKYLNALPENVYTLGRLGTYKYIDIGGILLQALEIMDKLGYKVRI